MPSGDHQRRTWREQDVDRRRQPKQEREAERPRQQREQATRQSEDSKWGRQSYPDRVAWPELLELAERRTKTLNVAYAEATRARRGAPR
jgi:hypothetical protein